MLMTNLNRMHLMLDCCYSVLLSPSFGRTFSILNMAEKKRLKISKTKLIRTLWYYKRVNSTNSVKSFVGTPF